MSKKFQYKKDPFNPKTGTFITNEGSTSARSGIHPFDMKWGPIPNGDYVIGETSNSGGMPRFFLDPKQDIGNRTALQIHPKSSNFFKNTFGLDTKGCISVDKNAFDQVRRGDSLNVSVRKVDMTDMSDVMRAATIHYGIFESDEFDPNDYKN